jgi:hypothetical protein
MHKVLLQSLAMATILGIAPMPDAADFDKKVQINGLRTLTGDGDKDAKTCPDNTFLCYESCCTNAEECCTTTQGCTAVGGCSPPSPQTIKQFDGHQR